MPQDNYCIFLSQCHDVLTKYPNLSLKEESGKKYIKGILDIPDDFGNIVRSFMVEIQYSNGFPFRFPILKEVGNELLCTPDWHKYGDSSCCITVEADEILQCRNGVTVSRFVKEFAIPYFANQVHRLLFGYYKNGEYAHGKDGIFQFYQKLFRSSSIDQWYTSIDIVFNGKRYHYNRNDACFCGSGSKIKNCHDLVFRDLQSIGLVQIKKDFKILFA